jgi:hypothetical protein
MGFANLPMRFHPSHDMGSMFCRACYAQGYDFPANRAARRFCPKSRHVEGIGL